MERAAAVAHRDAATDLTMPLEPLKIPPGVFSDATATAAEGHWLATQGVRFRTPWPEKDGGFVELYPSLPVGTPRAMRGWEDLSGTANLGAAGTQGLAVANAHGPVSPITPVSLQYTLGAAFTTSAGSATVTVADMAHQPSASGGWISFLNPVSVGGVVLFGTLFAAYVNGSSYTVTASQSASSTVADGGVTRQFTTTPGSAAVTVAFPNHGMSQGQITNLPFPAIVGGLTLSGNYVIAYVDKNTYQITAAAAATGAQTVSENNGRVSVLWFGEGIGASQPWQATDATLDNWGENLLACPAGGPIFSYTPETMGAPAAIIATAPRSCGAILVAPQVQILFALGSVNRTTNLFDPLLLSWSDEGDNTDFTPSTTNQAGSFRLSAGSRIIGGIAVGLSVLIWTDLTLYTAQYLGFPLVYGVNQSNTNCGLVGPHAVGVLGSNVFWMSQNQFFTLVGGAPSVLPCTVWDQVFQNLDPANAHLAWCWTNTFFNEITWYFLSRAGVWSRVRLQLDQQAWTYEPATTLAGTSLPAIQRTAGIDQSVLGPPIAADPSAVVYQHETGRDAAGAPLQTYLLTGAVMLAEGDSMIAVDQLIPDAKYAINGGPEVGDLAVNGYFYDYPQQQKGPRLTARTIAPTTETVPFKGRGRQMQLEFTGDDLGSWWRLGALHFQGKPDGRR